jgi:hypothetical protein
MCGEWILCWFRLDWWRPRKTEALVDYRQRQGFERAASIALTALFLRWTDTPTESPRVALRGVLRQYIPGHHYHIPCKVVNSASKTITCYFKATTYGTSYPRKNGTFHSGALQLLFRRKRAKSILARRKIEMPEGGAIHHRARILIFQCRQSRLQPSAVKMNC